VKELRAIALAVGRDVPGRSHMASQNGSLVKKNGAVPDGVTLPGHAIVAGLE